MRIVCPHCGLPAKVRTSRAMSLLTREVYAQCQNIECCHVFKALVGVTDTIVPSLNPNPAVFIRTAKKKTGPDKNQLPLLEPQ